MTLNEVNDICDRTAAATLDSMNSARADVGQPPILGMELDYLRNNLFAAAKIAALETLQAVGIKVTT